MKKNQCKDALDIYKKFLYRMTKLSEFLKVAEVSFAFRLFVYNDARTTAFTCIYSLLSYTSN